MFYLFTGYELIPIPPDTKIYVQAYYFERSNDHAYTVNIGEVHLSAKDGKCFDIKKAQQILQEIANGLAKASFGIIDVSHLVESYPADSADCCPQT